MKRITIDCKKNKFSLCNAFRLTQLASQVVERKAKYIDLLGLDIDELYKIYEALIIKWNLHLAGYELVKRNDMPTNYKKTCALCGKRYKKLFDHKATRHKIYGSQYYNKHKP